MITARNCIHDMNMIDKTGNIINLTIISLKFKNANFELPDKNHIQAIPLECPSRPVDFLLYAVSFLII